MTVTTAWFPALSEIERIAALRDPVSRNLQITQSYHEIARAFRARLNGCANWCVFATWASKQAGQTIRKEDLRRHFVHEINDSLEVQGVGEEVVAVALAAFARATADDVRSALWRSLDPAHALDGASDAVARGNLRVFAEIAPAFARFLAERMHDVQRDEEAIARFRETLRPGEPPDGQEYLRRAFTHYYDALFETDAATRTQLLFLANLEVGYHEQTRLQPEIAAALDMAGPNARTVTDRLFALLFPRAGWLVWLRRFLVRLLSGPTPLERAVSALMTEVQRQSRRILTEHFLTLALPGATLRLGRDLRADFPAALTRVSQVDLAELLRRIDPTPDSRRGSGALDWTDLPERMHFICDFFRCYHERTELSEAPFTPAQTALLKAGQLPAGEL